MKSVIVCAVLELKAGIAPPTELMMQYEKQAAALEMSFLLADSGSLASIVSLLKPQMGAKEGVIFVRLDEAVKEHSLARFFAFCQDKDKSVLQVVLENRQQSTVAFDIDEKNLLKPATQENAAKDFFYAGELCYLSAQNFAALLESKASDLLAFHTELAAKQLLLAVMESFRLTARRPCLFLDRDGVIIEDVGYPHKAQDLALVPGIVQLIKKAREKGFLVIAITNQAGIARGIFTQEQYNTFAEALNKLLRENGSPLDATYYCPHYPEATILDYKRVCLCRKPMPGLIMRAQQEHDVDLAGSLFIGDKDSDVVSYLPLKTWLLRGKYELKSEGVPIFSSMQDLLKKFGED